MNGSPNGSAPITIRAALLRRRISVTSRGLRGELAFERPAPREPGLAAEYAAEQAKSITDVDKQTKALETDLSTVNSPKWGLTNRYKFSATAHSPVPDAKIVQTITPTALVDGQYGRPGS